MQTRMLKLASKRCCQGPRNSDACGEWLGAPPTKTMRHDPTTLAPTDRRMVEDKLWANIDRRARWAYGRRGNTAPSTTTEHDLAKAHRGLGPGASPTPRSNDDGFEKRAHAIKHNTTRTYKCTPSTTSGAMSGKTAHNEWHAQGNPKAVPAFPLPSFGDQTKNGHHKWHTMLSFICMFRCGHDPLLPPRPHATRCPLDAMPHEAYAKAHSP